MCCSRVEFKIFLRESYLGFQSNFVFLVSFYASHARNAKEKRQRERDFFPFRERGGVFWRSSKERQNKQHAALAVLFCSLFSLVDGAFSGREGEKKRERERFRLSHVEKDTFFLLREIFSRY